MKNITFKVKDDGRKILSIEQGGMLLEKNLMPNEILEILSVFKNGTAKKIQTNKKKNIWVQLKDDKFVVVEIEEDSDVSVKNLKTESILFVEYNGKKQIAYYNSELSGYEELEEDTERAKLIGFYEGEDLGQQICVIPLDVKEKEVEKRLLRDFKQGNYFEKVLFDNKFGEYTIEAYKHVENYKLVFKIFRNGVHEKGVCDYQDNILKADKDMQESLEMWRIMHEYLLGLKRKGIYLEENIYQYITIV